MQIFPCASKLRLLLIRGRAVTHLHTAGSDTIFVQIYMDPPPEAPGVSKDAPGSTKHAI